MGGKYDGFSEMNAVWHTWSSDKIRPGMDMWWSKVARTELQSFITNATVSEINSILGWKWLKCGSLSCYRPQIVFVGITYWSLL